MILKENKQKSLITQYTYKDLFIIFFSLYSYVDIFHYMAVTILSAAFFNLT